MNHLRLWMERMWWNQKTPPFLLRGLSHVYHFFSALHLKHRHRHAETPPIPMISIGNITVGGSGKTPFVIWLVEVARARGFHPVVLCRGDGGRSKIPRLVSATDAADDIGDEAKLLFDRCHCPVIVGQNRVEASRMAADVGNILILDDGFQYRQLHRLCDVVLIPAEGVGNGCMIPAGPLREPCTALMRANIIVRTGDDPVQSLDVDVPHPWRWHPVSAGLKQVSGSLVDVPSRVWVATGIARPQRVMAMLRKHDVEVVGQDIFPDHYTFTAKDVRTISAHEEAIVVTEKDAVKLLPLWPKHLVLWVLRLNSEGEDGLSDAIFQHISV